jgi:signal transduction histidine kinase
MSQFLRMIRALITQGNSQLIFSNALLSVAASTSALTMLTSLSPVVVQVEQFSIFAWFALILALNLGVPQKAIAHMASIIAAIAVLTVSWYSGGIYSSTLAWMAVLIMGNYFVISRGPAVFWLFIYIAAHVAMVFSGPWLGVEPPLSSVSLAQALTALVDSSLVSMALVMVILFYHRSDVQSQRSLELRQEELSNETSKLKSLLSARERFLSAIGGGITPSLLAIQQWSENAAARYAGAPNALMVLEYNIRSALQSKLAVDELLQYARLSADQISVHMQYMVLRDELRTLVERLQTQAKASGSEYALELDKALPLVVYTDKDLLVQTLEKLIQCVDTAAGSAPVKIHAQAQGDSAIVISVEADISKGTNAKTPSFAPIALAGTDQTHAHSNGLAWPIAQSTAQLLGATVGVEIEPGPGTRYWIRLPTERKQ